MTMTFDLDLGTLEEDYERAKRDLDRELADASFDAAADGVEEAQDNHPYEDRTFQLTERATPRRAAGGEAAMVWGKEYASFVDKGTSRSKPYPFTPQAERRAEASLDVRTQRAVDKFTRAVSR